MERISPWHRAQEKEPETFTIYLSKAQENELQDLFEKSETGHIFAVISKRNGVAVAECRIAEK